MNSYKKYFDLSQPVQEALRGGEPIVALESTIVSHGMPYPENLQTALEVEKIVRDNGAIPATIGIIAGRIKVGLDHDDLKIIAESKSVKKVSQRDLPIVVNSKQDGATTVAATMFCAACCDMDLFVTGGIGGVHRDVSTSWDISADLPALAQIKVAVVSAGVKSLLDIEKTLEYLETWGVPTIGYQTHEFPSFYSYSSGLPVDYCAASPTEIAQVIKTKWELGLKGGVVVGVPIPKESALGKELEVAIEQSIEEAQKKGLKGKELTPFILEKVKQMTHGKSLKSNIVLIKNNAKIGAKIAVAMRES